MGNMLLRGVVHRHGRRIKIMKADGSVMKLRSPLCVKEILIDYPNHGIFAAPAGSPLRIGSFTRPLPERTELLAGSLYYLIPSPQDELFNYNNDSNRGSFARTASDHSIQIASSRPLQPPSSAEKGRDSIKSRDSLKQEEADCAVNKINRGGVTIVSSSHSTDGSTLRVKLRLRKEDLASFLSANNVNIVTENLMLPLSIEGASRQSPWKPSLYTIAETDGPLGYL